MASELKPCGGCGATSDRERCIGCLHDFGTPESAWVRPTPVAPVSPDATNAAQTFDQIVSYVLRYGGTCRDCADVDGICPNTDMPCGFELKTAVIKHTLKALEYGLSHGFIENPFSLPAPDATGKCGKLVTEFRTLSGEFVTRAQAEELLAAERAEKEEWKELHDAAQRSVKERTEACNNLYKQVNDLKADNAAQDAENAYLKELVAARGETIKRGDDHIRKLEAKLSAADTDAIGYRSTIEHLTQRAETAENKLAAAEKALEQFADIADLIDAETEGMAETDELVLHFHDYEFAKWPVSLFRQARAALGGKPS